MVVIEIQPDVEALFTKLGLCLTIAGSTPVPESEDHDQQHEASTPAAVKDEARQSHLKISLGRLDASQQVKAEEAEVTHDCDSKITGGDAENDDNPLKSGSELDGHDDKQEDDTATEPSVLTPASEEDKETSKDVANKESPTPKKETTSTAPNVDDIDNDHEHEHTPEENSFPSPTSTRSTSPEHFKKLKAIAKKKFTPRCPRCNAKAVLRVFSLSSAENAGREYWVCSKEVSWAYWIKKFLFYEDEVRWKEKMGLEGVDWEDLQKMGVAG